MSLDQLELSKKLVQAYRAWYLQTEASGEIDSGRTIFMDDLSGEPNNRFKLNDDQWVETFEYTLKNKNLLDRSFTRKVEESLFYFKSQAEHPNLDNFTKSGGVLGTNLETDISYYSAEIELLEKNIQPEFPDFVGSPVDYAKSLVDNGMTFIKSLCPSIRELDFVIEEAPANSLFLAQVVTNEEGQIVCQLMSEIKIGPLFAHIIIHEILGHVLHFTQLKNSPLQSQSPHLLVLSLHTHESFFIEAIAQIITFYLLMKSNWNFSGKHHVKLNCLKHMKHLAIMHHISSEILNKKISLDDAVSKHLAINPAVNPDFIKGRYEAVFKDLYSAKALLNYYSSFQAVLPLMKLKQDDFFNIIPEFLTTYFTPEKLNEFVKNQIDTYGPS